MWHKRLKAILLPVLLFLSLTVLTGFLLNFLVHSNSFRQYLLKHLSRTTGYEMSAEQLTLDFINGIGIRARNFRVCTREGREIAGAARIRINFSLKDLLRARIIPRELAILSPEIRLAAGRDQVLSFSGKNPALSKSYTDILAAFPRISLENAQVVLETAGLTLKELSIRLSRKSKRPVILETSFRGTALYDGAAIPFTGKGVIREEAENGLSVDGRCHIKKIPLAKLKLPEKLTVKNGDARLDVTVKWSPNEKLRMAGKLTFEGLDFLLIDDEDIKAFSFNQLTVPFNAAYANSVLNISDFQVRHKDFTLNGTSALNFINPADPHLDLKVKSPFMTLATFRRIFPSSLLPVWLENRIFPIFSGGQVSVNLFSLDGPWRRLGKS